VKERWEDPRGDGLLKCREMKGMGVKDQKILALERE
jgi:hypothetical protein